MKNSIKKILDIPIHYTFIFITMIVIFTSLIIGGDLTLPSVALLAAIAILFILQMYMGSIVIKSILAAAMIVYSATTYTSAVMSIHGNIIEPFLLTIGAATLFLTQTYSKSKMYYGIRSRVLWSSIITFVIVAFKLAFILSGYSFMITELVGAHLLIIFIAIWRLWLHNSSKTILIKPEIEKIKDVENLRFIYMNTKLNSIQNKWINGKSKKRENNAYSYIYNETLKAREEGFHVIFIYTKNNNNLYDIGEIKLSKSKKINYLYVESEDGTYMEKALEDFSEMISRS